MQAYRPADNNSVAVGFQRGDIQMLNVNKGVPFVHHGHTDQIYSLDFTDRYLVSGSGDGYVDDREETDNKKRKGKKREEEEGWKI